MPVDAYDPEKHHVGLGPSDPGTLYGFSIAGYAKSGQQYGGSQSYGPADALVGVPTLSRWTQSDFSGGDGQHVWGADAAMFSSCHGLLPTQLGKTIRTAPPLIRIASQNPNIPAGRKPLGSFTYTGYVYVVYAKGVVRVDLHTGVTSFYDLQQGGVEGITAFAFDRSYKALIVTFQGSINQAYKLPTFSATAYTADGYLGNPAQSGANTGLGVIGNKVVLCRGGAIYTLTIVENKDTYVLDSSAWKAPTQNRLPGTWVTSYVYNNFLYILCSDPDTGTALVYYDPGLDAVFNVCAIPYDFVAYSMIEYGGRIFIGGSGRDLNGNDVWAELYEVTGTTVRLVRTFSPESKSTAVSRPDAIRAMAVCEGLLFWGNKGKCLGVYDITADAFFDGPQLLEPLGVQSFYTLNAARGTVYTYLDNPSDPTKAGYYRIALAGDTPGAWTSKLTTSDFAPEVDRDKRWQQLKVMTRFGGCTAGYSFTGGAPGGDTFITLPVLEVKANGDNIVTSFDLSDVPVSPNVRLQLQFPRNEPASFTELVAYTLAFTMLDTGKRVWSFTVNATQYVEGRDRLPTVQNVHDISDELERYYIGRIPLDFADVDGRVYKVTLTSFNQQRPIIGPEVDLQPEGSYESLIGVQLVEV